MSPAAVEALVILAAKYGPELVIKIAELMKKKDITVEDVETLFSNVKPYEAYGIK